MQTSNGTTVLVQGRIVWTSGDLFQGRVKTDYNSQKPKLNAKGEEMKEYGFGLAIDKTSFGDNTYGGQDLWNAMHTEAQSLYPSGQLPPDFSMKYKDGDGIDHKGVPFSQRQGYAGNLVFTMTTSLPIKWFKSDENDNYTLINEGVKCGDFVRVQCQVKAHGAVGQGKPGLYLNPLAVEFTYYGEEIINAPSGDQIFGGAPQMPMPEGASTQPPPTNTPFPNQAPQPAAPAQPQAPQPQAPTGMPAPQPAAPAQPQAPQPHHGVLPPTGHQAPQPAAPAQPQAPQPQAPTGMPPIPGGNQ